MDRPGALSYRDLTRHVPKADRASWHSRAMEVADSAELGEAISLWLETREIDRLVDRLRRTPPRVLKGLSHYVTEPAARRLEKAHPDVAATLHSALGLRILEQGKSRYYAAALGISQTRSVATAPARTRLRGSSCWPRCIATIVARRAFLRRSANDPPTRGRPNPGSNAPASAGHRDGERPGPQPASTGFPASRSVRKRSGRRALPAG